jgi:gamma-butyrobetaine dioxygenase
MMRYSYFTYAPHVVPFEFMEEWYKAYNAFAKVVRDLKHQYRFLLNPGDFVLYDNHRMFHARTGFTGPRHVRGIYFHTEDVFRKLLN